MHDFFIAHICYYIESTARCMEPFWKRYYEINDRVPLAVLYEKWFQLDGATAHFTNWNYLNTKFGYAWIGAARSVLGQHVHTIYQESISFLLRTSHSSTRIQLILMRTSLQNFQSLLILFAKHLASSKLLSNNLLDATSCDSMLVMMYFSTNCILCKPRASFISSDFSGFPYTLHFLQPIAIQKYFLICILTTLKFESRGTMYNDVNLCLIIGICNVFIKGINTLFIKSYSEYSY